MPINSPIQPVEMNDNFNTGRNKWNENDRELEARVNSIMLFQNALFYEKHTGATFNVHALGAEFQLTSFSEDLPSAKVLNGSVLLVINGMYYLSHTDQSDSAGATDFHLEDRSIVVHDTVNGGTIDILETDALGIYFQKQ